MTPDKNSSANLQTVKTYHEETKHHYHRYANALGYLDWNSQPDPFRRFIGAELIKLSLSQTADTPRYDDLFTPGKILPAELSCLSIGQFLENSLAISAWKQLGVSKWALRVNPSSGNLHPTEGYVILPAVEGLSDKPGVFHYAPLEHGLEKRAVFAKEIWEHLPEHIFFVGLSSIYWREAWKYGERAFRYCQHDGGHAYMALDISARMLGWKINLVSSMGDEKLAQLLGLNRKDEFKEQEGEYPELLAIVNTKPQDQKIIVESFDKFIDGVVTGQWFGKANLLSTYHQEWDVIEVVHQATLKPESLHLEIKAQSAASAVSEEEIVITSRQIVQQRRSAVEMDGQTFMSKKQFFKMLGQVNAGFDGIPWNSKIDLCFFVHRVTGLEAGLYILVRNIDAQEKLYKSLQPDFKWEIPTGCPAELKFYRLKEGDVVDISKSVSCGQNIAGDGAFSLAMMAEYDQSLEEFGAWFYKRLFWEAGMIGQILYLEAEAIGISATGIGCYFDDAVHELLGMKGSAFQDLYHFTVGKALTDDRLTTLPAY